VAPLVAIVAPSAATGWNAPLVAVRLAALTGVAMQAAPSRVKARAGADLCQPCLARVGGEPSGKG
jgi:hypothetical protein